MISIIVSIYKVEKYLRQCIESVLHQTYSGFELILVNDGSPDNCPAICDEYAAVDKRIKVIHKENGGLLSTRKTGVLGATGEYVCFIDGDDFVQADMLETYVSVLEASRADVVCASCTRYIDDETPGDRIIQMIPSGIYHKQQLMDHVYSEMLSTKPFYTFYIMPSVCTKCFKREMIQQVYCNMPDAISLGEDSATSYPALLMANTIAVVDYYGYCYRQNQSSMTHSYDKKLYGKVKNLLNHMDAVKEKYAWDAERQLNEYAIALLNFARINELVYNTADKYRSKKRNMLVYLSDKQFEEAIKHVQLSGIKNNFVLWCYRLKLIYPLFIWEKIQKKS